MRFNDMSLPDGGGFDINGAWFLTTSQTVDCKSSGGHCWHRLGKSVDIENAGPTNLIKLKGVLEPPAGNWIFVNEGKSVFPHFQGGVPKAVEIVVAFGWCPDSDMDEPSQLRRRC